MNRSSLVAASAAVLSLAGAAIADTWYIGGANASDANGGTSPTDAFATPAAAFAAGGSHDTFLFAAGTYPCAVADAMIDSVTISGLTGDPADVVLDAGGADYALSLGAAHVVIENVTVTGAAAFGVLLTGADSGEAPTIENCVFTANGNGLGLYHADDAVVTDCDFTSNTGGGAWVAYANNSSWTGCRFLHNQQGLVGYDWNGGDRNGDPHPVTATRCIFAHNSSYGANMVADNAGSGTVFDHCTFFGNMASVFYGHYYGGAVTNSIIVGTFGNVSSWRRAGSVWDSVSKSLLNANGPSSWSNANGTGPGEFGGTVYSGCTEGEPSFVDPYGGDFRLYSDSAALLAGSLCEDGTVPGAYPDPVDAVAVPAGTLRAATPGNIDATLALVEPGDTVTLSPGTYSAITLANISGSATKPVRIVGEDGARVVNPTGAGITLSQVANVSIENLEVSGCGGNGIYAAEGYAVNISGCSVCSNGDSGIALLNAIGSLVAECVVSTNAHHGVHLGCATGNTILRSFVEQNGNRQTYWCYGVNIVGRGLNNVQGYACCNRVVESSVSGNFNVGIAASRTRDEGLDGHVFCNEVDSSVVYGNGGAGIAIGIRHCITVTNTIVSHNVQEAFHSEGVDTFIVDYCDIFGNGSVCNDGGLMAGENNIYADPKYVDPTKSDYHLWEGSPAIDAGFGPAGTDIGMYPEGPVKEIEVGADFFVAPDGDDAADGLSRATAFATVAHAATVATAGSTVTIAAGSYTGTVDIAASATGMDGLPVVYRAEGAVEFVGTNGPALSLAAVTWNEFHGIRFTSETGAGALLVSGSDVLFSNCVFEACATYGVRAEGNSRTAFVDCVVRGNASHGIYLLTCNDSSLLRCSLVANGGAGMRAGEGRGSPSTGVSVRYCFASRNGGYGIDTPGDNSKNWLVDHCTFLGNAGMAFGYNGGGHWSTATITNSIFAYNVDGGIYLSNTTLDIGGNIFHANGSYGITDGATYHAASDKGGNIEANPSPCNWFHREDGALFADSPALGACPDGSNIGSYQGAGVPLPVASTFYVRPDGNDANDGSADTAEAAFATITAAALVATNAGDTVRIAPGVYLGPAAITGVVGAATAPVSYVAEEGAVVSGPANGNVLRVEKASGVRISGLAVTGCTGWYRGGLNLVDAYGCEFDGLVATNNFFGVYAVYRSPGNLFRDCLIAGNSNCGLYLGSMPASMLERCEISGNASHGLQSSGHDGQWYNTTWGLVLRHCVVSGNIGSGLAEGNYGCINAENCVVYGNGGSGVYFTHNSRPSAIRNTIVAGNTGYGFQIIGGGNNVAFDHCCVYGNAEGDKLTNQAFEFDAGTVFADPLFRDAAAGDFHIAIGSPCMDAGTNQDWMAEAKDFGGVNPRVIRDIVDIGAYEVGIYGTMILVR